MAYRPLEARLFRIDGDEPILLGSRCAACGRSFFPRRRRCAACMADAEPVDLSPEGVLYAHTFVRVPFFGRQQVDTEGYGVGQVDLPEGVRVQTVLLGDPDSWRIGMPMRISLDVVDRDNDDEVAIFRFRPAGEHARA